jgi:hypothetical protein
MAKKRQNISNLYYALAAGAITFFGYRAWMKQRGANGDANGSADANADAARRSGEAAIEEIKRRQQETASAQKTENERKRTEQQANALGNPQSFANKVGQIQAILGVRIDGKPGPVTHDAYQKRFGLDRGSITPMTVQYYLDRANRDKFFI